MRKLIKLGLLFLLLSSGAANIHAATVDENNLQQTLDQRGPGGERGPGGPGGPERGAPPPADHRGDVGRGGGGDHGGFPGGGMDRGRRPGPGPGPIDRGGDHGGFPGGGIDRGGRPQDPGPRPEPGRGDGRPQDPGPRPEPGRGGGDHGGFPGGGMDRGGRPGPGPIDRGGDHGGFPGGGIDRGGRPQDPGPRPEPGRGGWPGGDRGGRGDWPGHRGDPGYRPPFPHWPTWPGSPGFPHERQTDYVVIPVSSSYGSDIMFNISRLVENQRGHLPIATVAVRMRSLGGQSQVNLFQDGVAYSAPYYVDGVLSEYYFNVAYPYAPMSRIELRTVGATYVESIVTQVSGFIP